MKFYNIQQVLGTTIPPPKKKRENFFFNFKICHPGQVSDFHHYFISIKLVIFINIIIDDYCYCNSMITIIYCCIVDYEIKGTDCYIPESVTIKMLHSQELLHSAVVKQLGKGRQRRVQHPGWKL